MDILIKTATNNEVNRWGSPPDKVGIPGTGDVVFPSPDDRPLAIGSDHFLATATVVDEAIGDSQKSGPEVVSVVGQEVTVTRTAVDKDADDLMIEWEGKRVRGYGSWGEQLDMQYWDGVNDTTVWVDHVAKVKSDHPKPT
jgi:hypothetical protein